ncbi:MAG: histidine phosphatase family protein [Desulfobacterales bacterium]
MEKKDIRILLVRHGETEWNRTRRFQGRCDTPLNETGVRQAEAVAGMLKDEAVTTAYTSPLLRAKETAKRIMDYHSQARLIEEPDFIEMDLGTFDGMDAVEWSRMYPNFMNQWRENPGTLRMPGGECLDEVRHRAVSALYRIIAKHPDNSTVLICSHNFVILSLLCFAKGIPLDGFRRLRQSNGAVSIICVKNGVMTVTAVNLLPEVCVTLPVTSRA